MKSSGPSEKQKARVKKITGQLAKLSKSIDKRKKQEKAAKKRYQDKLKSCRAHLKELERAHKLVKKHKQKEEKEYKRLKEKLAELLKAAKVREAQKTKAQAAKKKASPPKKGKTSTAASKEKKRKAKQVTASKSTTPVSKVEKAPVAEAVKKTVAPAAAPTSRPTTSRKPIADNRRTRTPRRTSAEGTPPAPPQAPVKDRLRKIEGIGPKIEALLHTSGIPTFKALAAARLTRLRAILAEAGPSYKRHSPSTWPKQARLAAAGKWEELKALQDELHGGREKK
ncbi:MAG: hypothetical protein AAFV95_01805 [Bacteroidota bacterium]